MDVTTQQDNPASPQIPSDVRAYLQNILDEAGTSNVNDALLEEMILELYNRLDSYIATVIMEKLPATHTEEFLEMNRQGKPQAEIEKYLHDHIDNYQDMMVETLAEFRDIYLGNIRTYDSYKMDAQEASSQESEEPQPPAPLSPAPSPSSTKYVN